MDLVCSWGFLSFSFSWQQLKLWVMSEHRAFGDLGIFGTTPGSLSDCVVSETVSSRKGNFPSAWRFSAHCVHVEGTDNFSECDGPRILVGTFPKVSMKLKADCFENQLHFPFSICRKGCWCFPGYLIYIVAKVCAGQC